MLTYPTSQSARTETSEMETLSSAAPAGESIVALEYLWLATILSIGLAVGL
ncbi:MAG TPA: hypothetical protein VKA84_06130 [Gemmatimonadaceae bacterium]|nr:hypothetical protein [Gemmatimonadaceae bacterium]